MPWACGYCAWFHCAISSRGRSPAFDDLEAEDFGSYGKLSEIDGGDNRTALAYVFFFDTLEIIKNFMFLLGFHTPGPHCIPNQWDL